MLIKIDDSDKFYNDIIEAFDNAKKSFDEGLYTAEKDVLALSKLQFAVVLNGSKGTYYITEEEYSLIYRNKVLRA